MYSDTTPHTIPPAASAVRRARPYRRATVWLILALAVLVLALWTLGTPAGLHNKVLAIGYAICHQIPARSFLLNGQPLPLCARCTGIYLGVMLSLGLLLASGRGKAALLPPRTVLALFALFAILMAADGLNSYLTLFPGYAGLYAPQNWLRLVTGSLAGIVVINLVFPVFNRVIWARPDAQQTVASLGELDGLLIVVALADALVIAGSPLALLVFGLVSAAGPLVVLTMVGAVLFVSFARRENTAVQGRDLLLPAVAGLALAFTLIGAVDALRYGLTGTWDGAVFAAMFGLDSG